MRWAHKYRGMPPVGTVRYRQVFLWLPRVDTDNYWRWFEKAWVKQTWDQGCFNCDIAYVPDGRFKWRTDKVLPRGTGYQGFPDHAVDGNGRPVVKAQDIAP